MTSNDPEEFWQLLRSTVAHPGAPQWIGHLVSGIQESDSSDPAAGRPAPARHSRVARLVSMLCFEEDRQFEEVQTGGLLRVVAEGEEGAVYCLPIVRGRHLVGVLTGDGAPTAVGAADKVMIDLVDRLRADIGLTSLDVGGLARDRGRYGPRPEADADDPADSSPGAGRALRGGPERDFLAPLIAPTQVHWAAVVRDRDVVASGDCFADARMDKYFVIAGQETRRRFYGEFARAAGPLMNRVGRLVRPAVGGPLRRLVLDVEQGVVVVHRIGPQEQLVGVTLDQSRVNDVERLLRQATDQLTGQPAR